MTAKSWRLPLLWSGMLLLSQAFPFPSPVRDVATGAWPGVFSLQLPAIYVIFAPAFGIADRLTLLSFNQLILFAAAAVFCGFIAWGLKRGLLFLFGFAAFAAWAVLVPRPMARLWAPQDTLLIDFHSHTRSSHDGRPTFTADANRRWHSEQGFGASFITDHNKIESAQEGKTLSRANWRLTDHRSLEGEEISLWKTHLVVLGNHEWIDNVPYDSNPKKVEVFIKDMRKRGIPVIASLPEYWLHHWPINSVSRKQDIFGQAQRPTYLEGFGQYFSDINDFSNWGITGFEILNGAPKALDFPPAARREIVELCRANNLFMTGVSDNHGYGYAAAVWSAMRIPRWNVLGPDQLEAAVLNTLRAEKFTAVQVLERVRFNPENTLQLVASPLVNVVLYWRALQPLEAISWVVWIWLIYGLRSKFRKQKYVREN